MLDLKQVTRWHNDEDGTVWQTQWRNTWQAYSTPTYNRQSRHRIPLAHRMYDELTADHVLSHHPSDSRPTLHTAQVKNKPEWWCNVIEYPMYSQCIVLLQNIEDLIEKSGEYVWYSHNPSIIVKNSNPIARRYTGFVYQDYVQPNYVAEDEDSTPF